jgi:hypothetical protein
MKNLWMLFAVMTAFFFACQQAPKTDAAAAKTDSTKTASLAPSEGKVQTKEIKEEQRQKTIYRSDGFRPGLVSEWIEVHYEPGNKIGRILYWNTQDEKPIELKINKQEYIAGEITGYTGELQFPDDEDKYGFGILEGEFKLTYPDKRMQEFEYESAD